MITKLLLQICLRLYGIRRRVALVFFAIKSVCQAVCICRVCVCVCACIYIYIYIYIYVCVCECVCVCVVCVCVVCVCVCKFLDCVCLATEDIGQTDNGIRDPQV